MSSSSKCYYESLNVPLDASLEDIKEQYRSLCKAHHPDVATSGNPNQNAEKFKEISNAYQTLSNPKERRLYDMARAEERHWYRNRTHAEREGWGFHNSNMRGPPPPKGPKATGLYAVLETMYHPRNFILGIIFCIGGSWMYNSVFAKQDHNSFHQKQKHLMDTAYRNQLVEAWKNPKTGRWEQPAPWDPTYRRIRPTLEMVPRDRVHRRTR